ncbi:hypothetical protein [Alicyclobacillus suci]|uniref:hypothetical protein n=1 Tax=Alicyclobacillus suci TaxID=2816080 RepID=UPI001A8EBE16|nr:hypothetical protein [Alicyclobacillus suci]
MKANQAVNLTVNTIAGNSGVYFGNQNIAIGVSSHSKSNSVIGSIGSQNLVYRNINLIYDPDVIDTPIDDRDIHVFAPHYQHSAPNVLNTRVNDIQCETITQNSGVFIGETRITGLDAHQKENIAYGQTYGHVNQSKGNLNIAYDPDVVDALIDDRDVKSGVFVAAPEPPVVAQRTLNTDS